MAAWTATTGTNHLFDYLCRNGGKFGPETSEGISTVCPIRCDGLRCTCNRASAAELILAARAICSRIPVLEPLRRNSRCRQGRSLSGPWVRVHKECDGDRRACCSTPRKCRPTRWGVMKSATTGIHVRRSTGRRRKMSLAISSTSMLWATSSWPANRPT